MACQVSGRAGQSMFSKRHGGGGGSHYLVVSQRLHHQELRQGQDLRRVAAILEHLDRLATPGPQAPMRISSLVSLKSSTREPQNRFSRWVGYNSRTRLIFDKNNDLRRTTKGVQVNP